MKSSDLKRLAQLARRQLIQQVGGRLEHILNTDKAQWREQESAIAKLNEHISATSKTAVIEKVAYIWFNRFCALRYMDIHGYNRIQVVSPLSGHTQPEILLEAKQGHIEATLLKAEKQKLVQGLLSGTISSPNGQAEAYQHLLVATCNAYSQLMPFMFEEIADYTELLLPTDLLSEDSILGIIRSAMDQESAADIEIIGWLYQYYISEKKDEVFAGLKKNIKITAENIPAATQLFTPHWIVRYMVENSLGRLWMLNHPESTLKQKMEYYIEPTEPETDFLQISSPEELKICDPACGSGHILVYAFDLLYAIYAEAGYSPAEIPGHILRNNLFGIEIDQRAGALAAFALFMKAVAQNKQLLQQPIQPNICVLENVTFESAELAEYIKAVGENLFTTELNTLLNQFTQADHVGSLIQPANIDLAMTRQELSRKHLGNNLFLHNTHDRVLKVINQAEYLSQRYHVVVANPPYMGGKGMNGVLKAFAEKNYPDSKSDLFAMFMERILDMLITGGYSGFMTPFTWMFLSSYMELRKRLLSKETLTSLIRPEYHAFFESAYVPICSFTVCNKSMPEYKGTYIDLANFNGADIQQYKALDAIKNKDCSWVYRASASDFKKIPGSPIAYWVSDQLLNVFESSSPLSNYGKPTQGLATGDNARFTRSWHEVSRIDIGNDLPTRQVAKETGLKWFPYNKGGDFRYWYGNQDYVVNWQNDGEEIRSFYDSNGKLRSRPQNMDHYFHESISWSKISSSNPAFRYFPNGFIFDVAGTSIFINDPQIKLIIIGFCNSIVSRKILTILSPTLNFEVGHISILPFRLGQENNKNISDLIGLSKTDWDAYEISWGFNTSPLIPLSEGDRVEEGYPRAEVVDNNEDSSLLSSKGTNQAPLIEGGIKVGSSWFPLPRLPYNPNLTQWSKDLRHNLTPEERKLWYDFLSPHSVRFLRQRIIDNYIVDFYCASAKLVIEVDGSQHYTEEGMQKDQIRTEVLQTYGINVLRFTNQEIKNNFDGVCQIIQETLQSLMSSSAKGELKEESLQSAYSHLRTHWRDMTLEMQKLEVENNRIFIDAYGLQDELTPDVPLEEITLTCNPWYRYGKKCEKQETGIFPEEPDLEARLLLDTMKEYISYAVGCMFGRYSLDKPGLILANQGECLEDYLKQVSEPTFMPDDDNIIPILDGDWFPDDITGRFKKFLRTTFGDNNYDENLAFIENALGKDIRKYFVKDFYKDHWQRYKKRPIYWLFKSPKGSFSALIYMHRYRPDLVSKLLNDYLRDFQAKLEAQLRQQTNLSVSPSASDKDKIKASKTIEQTKKMLHELEEYDRNILYPLATRKIEIDLDDGVKVNYARFGNALEKIPGLEDKEE